MFTHSLILIRDLQSVHLVYWMSEANPTPRVQKVRILSVFLSVCLLVCLCVCPDDNFRTNDPIEFKLLTRLLELKTEVKFVIGQNRTRRFEMVAFFRAKWRK